MNDAGESAKSATVTATTSTGSGGLRRARPRRIPPRELRQRLRLHPAVRRPRQLGHHRPGLRRADLHHLRRHPLHPLPRHRVPDSRERRRLQGRDQSQAVRGQEGAEVSIGGQNGQVQLTTTAARDTFVSSVSKISSTPTAWTAWTSTSRATRSRSTPPTRTSRPDHAGDRQPDLGPEDPEGQVRLHVRPDDGPGDLLRPTRLPVLRHGPVGRPGLRGQAPISPSSTPCATT